MLDEDGSLLESFLLNGDGARMLSSEVASGYNITYKVIKDIGRQSGEERLGTRRPRSFAEGFRGFGEGGGRGDRG